jgi:DNA ligase-associated metallophosphoesterase
VRIGHERTVKGLTFERAARFEMHDIDIAGAGLIADASGALFLPAERALIVADLHLEKGSSYARRRILLPPYDTAATLARLARVVARYAPRRVIALGDSFHDRMASARLGEADRRALRSLQAGRDWIWIAGNHDPDVPQDCGGEAMAVLRIGPLVLRHEPALTDDPEAHAGEIAGHLHPVAQVVSLSGTVRRRCFVSNRRRCIMPAFGAFAGGLNLRDRAVASLFGPEAVMALVLGRDRIHAVPDHRCAPD